MKRTIYVTSDHGGFDLKSAVVDYLQSQGLKVKDIGPEVKDPQDDYPDYALLLVRHLRKDDMGVGIAMCRSAQGMCMSINRNPGLRAALAWNEEEAKKSRQHEDANVLCLSNDYVEQAENLKIIDAWLQEEFLGTDEPRHARRLAKLESYFPL